MRKETDPRAAVIGARIADRRTAMGKSQAWLGDAIGVSFQQVQKYESGQDRLSILKALAICQALEMPLADLIHDLEKSIEAFEPISARTMRLARRMEIIFEGDDHNIIFGAIDGMVSGFEKARSNAVVSKG